MAQVCCHTVEPTLNEITWIKTSAYRFRNHDRLPYVRLTPTRSITPLARSETRAITEKDTYVHGYITDDIRYLYRMTVHQQLFDCNVKDTNFT